VLSIQGNDVKLIDTVAMGDEVASVAITPDGKRALATKFPARTPRRSSPSLPPPLVITSFPAHIVIALGLRSRKGDWFERRGVVPAVRCEGVKSWR